MKAIEKALDLFIPQPVCELQFSNNFELLIAVILSAQCTDKRVNSVTKTLFQKYKTPKDFVECGEENLAKEIYSLGFYRNKSKNIIKMCKDLIEKHNSKVPGTQEELTSLAGVGRKTANVVLSVGFNQNAFAVDTHVFRVSNRLGIVSTKSVTECEEKLKQYFKGSNWSKIHLQLVNLGRYVCKARNPNCNECHLKEYCKFFNQRRKNVSR